MTILSCKIFRAIVEQGSLNGAAAMLHLTPSAVSHAVTSMEKEVGFRIFNRSKTGVTLTGYGEELYPYVITLINSEENLNQIVDQLNGMERGTVRIGAFNSVCTHWLPTIMKAYQEKFPAIEMEIHEGTYDDVISWLEDGVVELGFLSASCKTDLHVEPLYQDPLVCLAPKGMKTARPGCITPAEMSGHSFVIQRASCDADIKKFLSDANLEVRTSCHVTDDQATAAMVASGFGIGILPELAARNLTDDLDTLWINGKLTAARMICLATDLHRNLSPAAERMKELILELSAEGNL